MPTHFDLVIQADPANRGAELRLHDAHGALLAYRHTDFNQLAVSRLQGLFNLRNYLRLYVAEGKEAAAVAEIGVCIAEEVLGADIFGRLWESASQRTLRVQLPGATETANPLAAALARVPWEIARPRSDQPTLGERNLLVRVVHDMNEPASEPVALSPGEELRVLFVFAEARQSRPLGARQERHELQQLLEREIYPERRVVAHFLTHGVTRERLEEQITQNNGYHVVHWSGHGHLNLLELAKAGDDHGSDRISGEELLDLFHRAGGFLPRLVFLSACHSGDVLRVRDWQDFLAVAQGKEPGAKGEADVRGLDLPTHPGFTGTAHALLRGGVPSVVAMRYAVGDDYARELAVEFYRALLAHPKPKSAAAALTLARRTVGSGKHPDATRFVACDHATPLLYGAEQPGLTLAPGRSSSLNPPDPRLVQINELTTGAHEHFVGRTWELAGLGADFIGSSTGAEVKPVAVIIGLGGMGKTALVAEALALWETRFDWVLLYQAKPDALGFEGTLRDLHRRLMGELGRYHDHVKARPADAIFRDGNAEFTGPERLERLTRNLLRAMKDEGVLLVLDNFERNLKEHPEPASIAGQPVWACQDPAWEGCLSLLARELVGSPSRVLLTCRKPLAALADPDHGGYPVLLGPLPPPEAALYLQAHPALGRMVFGGDPGERALALRLLNASRFHPLLMDRLARLAATPALRGQLLQALDTLEKTKNFAQLPALFAARPGDAKELAYLDDALAVSLDQLIRDASPDARRLLWMIAVANEPIMLGLLKSVWNGEDSLPQARLRWLKRKLGNLPSLPLEEQEKLKTLALELREELEALPPEPPPKSKIWPLLRYLISVGLTIQQGNPEDDASFLTCHELVQERIRTHMAQHPPDQGEFAENAIRVGYAKHLTDIFVMFRLRSEATALQAGAQALVYCVQAGAWDELTIFASSLITSIIDPRQLDALLPHLQFAAESMSEGQDRWLCLACIADLLDNAGKSDTSLLFYERAATQVLTVARAGGVHSKAAWSNYGTIKGNWGVALARCGRLDEARQCQLDAAEAHSRAGGPTIEIISRELELASFEVVTDNAASVIPRVQALLEPLQAWWKDFRSGKPVPEVTWAPDRVLRVLTRALELGAEAAIIQEDWPSALSQCDAIIELQEQRASETSLAYYRVNRAGVRHRLGFHREAKEELENCLEVFRNDPSVTAKVLNSLAGCFHALNDHPQAVALYRRALINLEQTLYPLDRAKIHSNLAGSLAEIETQLETAESSRHALAALLYCLGSNARQDLGHFSTHNYVPAFRRAHASGTELIVPRVIQLLADPAFRALEQWLSQREVNVEELQGSVDHFLEQVRQTALQPKH